MQVLHRLSSQAILHLQVFDRLQYANYGGGKAGRSCHVHDVRYTEGRHMGAVPVKIFETLSCNYHSKAGSQSIQRVA